MTTSRVLSLAVSMIGMVAAAFQFHPERIVDYCIIIAAATALIWFPDAISYNAVRKWVDGYSIDNPTPPLMVAAFGWIALLVMEAYIFRMF